MKRTRCIACVLQVRDPLTAIPAQFHECTPSVPKVSTSDTPPHFYMMSVKHSRGDDILWWGPDRCGYTTSLSRAGRYLEADAKKIQRHHGASVVCAVPCEVVDPCATPRVSSEHINGFRRTACVCDVRGCDLLTEPGAAVCVSCQAGEATGIDHLVNRTMQSQTWCGLDLLPDGSRTRKTRECVAWQAVGLLEARKLCGACVVASEGYERELRRKHRPECGAPDSYCEGCRHNPECEDPRCEGCVR